VDVFQALFEIEVWVGRFSAHTDVAARGEAPVSRLDLLTVHQFHQPRDSLQLSLWESVLQPRHLPVEVDRCLELIDGRSALLIELLHQLAGRAAVIRLGHGVVSRQLAA